ncbi:copper homeostasis protein CutC [Micrococcales bacterium 31B]|nr:copper homeostasis protein CutC [Micrococcales bacterium 31B]
MTLLEICLDDADGVAIAEAHGADRIELCSALIDGGLTPSLGTFEESLDSSHNLGIQVLIRQRGGDFVYSRREIDAMCRDIAAMRAATAAHAKRRGIEAAQATKRVGFVFGALTPSGTLDLPALTQLHRACGAFTTACHKAFDQTPDLGEALEQLIALGIDRVLTSGGPGGAADNLPTLAALRERAAGRIAVLVGGGVRAHNVRKILAATGADEVHLRAQQSLASPSTQSSVYDAGHRLVTSPAAIDELVALLR